MNWRHKMGLEHFARSGRSLTVHNTPNLGVALWKALIAKGWIAPTDVESSLRWWQRPHKITNLGSAALGMEELSDG